MYLVLFTNVVSSPPQVTGHEVHAVQLLIWQSTARIILYSNIPKNGILLQNIMCHYEESWGCFTSTLLPRFCLGSDKQRRSAPPPSTGTARQYFPYCGSGLFRAQRPLLGKVQTACTFCPSAGRILEVIY